VCRRCGWEDSSYEAPTIPARDVEEVAAALAEACTPSSDFSWTASMTYGGVLRRPAPRSKTTSSSRGHDRFYAFDPFGNRLEFIEAR
jgi:hypothetical protein